MLIWFLENINDFTYFWEFEATQIKYFLPIYLIGTIFAFYLTPKMVKRFDKRNIVVICIGMVGILSPAAFIFYNLGLTPPKGSIELVAFISLFLFILITFNIIGIMTRDSMLGDISDEVELESGKRQEGILYAAISFMGKVNTGLGSFTAGLVLSLIGFKGSNSTDSEIYSLLIIQGPVVACLVLIPAFLVYKYKITRKKHAEIIFELNFFRGKHYGGQNVFGTLAMSLSF